MSRYCLAALVPILFVLAPIAQAGDKAVPPAVVVRVQSLDALLQNLNLVVKLVGQEEAARQIEGLVKSKIGAKGLEGIDPARPFGAFFRFGKAIDDIHGAVLIPMADEKTFLRLLENLNVQAKKDAAGIYTYKNDQNIDVYFRFANKYLFITTINPASIQDKNLVDPAVALNLPGKATISVLARIDQIPNDIKKLAQDHLDEAIRAAEKGAPPNETKAQEAFRRALLGDAGKFGANVLRDGGDLRFDLNVNDKTKEMTIDFAITGKPGSDLAKAIQSVGNLKSPLAGILAKDQAFHGSFHLALPDSLKQALGNVIAEASEKSLEGIQDPAKKKQAEALFKSLTPSATQGEFQVVAAAVGPANEQYTFIAAVKLKDGDKLGTTIHDLMQDALKTLPAEQQAKVKLNAHTVGAVKIHEFQLPSDKNTDALVKVTGDNHLYLAFRDDAVFLAMGKDALATMKAAVAKTDNAASLPLVFDFDVARMAGLMAQTPEQKDLARKLFAAGQTGRIRLTIEGGSTLNARLHMQLNVLEFLVKMKDK